MTKLRTLSIAALCGGALLATGPAGAHAAPKPLVVKSRDAHPGGLAIFGKDRNQPKRPGFSLLVCDVQKDGYGVLAYASYRKHGKQNKVTAYGGGGTCNVLHGIKAARGRTVHVTVCLRDKEDPLKRKCAFGNAGAWRVP